jgi:hypothetical protein
MSAPSQTTSAERLAELLDVKAFPPPPEDVDADALADSTGKIQKNVLRDRAHEIYGSL